MNREAKDMSGALFKNTRKETDQHPDYNGTIVVHGEHLWISAWIKESAAGKKYMSLSVKPKDAAPQRQNFDQGRSKPMPSDDIDDEIPF